MKQFKENPWTTGAALFILLVIGIDVIWRGIHTEHSIFAALAVGLLKSISNKKQEKQETE
ncbi:hypothetical protein [Adhaeribacter rhizoryzae]|uniref:Uncharacterized protein n=1 Tax=Adhaeribacter rhizoryzae TaxID=2607907 RepID=A0A5M6CX32_9BACT|nr:hypothetical protein [Adhaeribacter rhizoryzae]KAA5539797.1 hypothetical protein F0145_23715 [Adhaeribacter rhizoryzae]